MRVVGGGAESEFMQPELTGEHNPRLFEFGDHEGVLSGHAVAQEAGATRGGDASRVAEVFEREGDAVQGATIAPDLQLRVGGGGLRARQIVGASDESVARRLRRIGAGEDRFSQRRRGQTAITQGASSGGDGEAPGLAPRLRSVGHG